MPPTTPPKVLGKPRAKPKPPGLDAIRITLEGHGSYVLRDDWTARVSERCRRELGRIPETILVELLGNPQAKEDRVSLDTIVRAFVFAAWQNGAADVSYDDLLDRVTMKTEVTLEPNPEDSSPEV